MEQGYRNADIAAFRHQVFSYLQILLENGIRLFRINRTMLLFSDIFQMILLNMNVKRNNRNNIKLLYDYKST